MNKLPATAKELVEELDHMFPHRCPTIDQTERQIFLYAGKRALVDYLMMLLQESIENNNTSNIR